VTIIRTAIANIQSSGLVFDSDKIEVVCEGTVFIKVKVKNLGVLKQAKFELGNFFK
jgi:hypothetical protein